MEKTKLRKTGIEEEGFLSGGKPRNRTSVILIGGGPRGGKTFHENGVLSAKLDENRIVFTKIDKI
ncbi:hypothetical protein MHU86_9668 (mitochondrion) [Fragilaria crotonensis]|nr:hypothetical protein MHU86_9668 [Fragilaria crotonensis]